MNEKELVRYVRIKQNECKQLESLMLSTQGNIERLLGHNYYKVNNQIEALKRTAMEYGMLLQEVGELKSQILNLKEDPQKNNYKKTYDNEQFVNDVKAGLTNSELAAKYERTLDAIVEHKKKLKKEGKF